MSHLTSAAQASGVTSSASEPLRVVVIGYGMGGAVFHAPLIAATPGMRVAAVVTGNPQRAADVRARHEGALVLATPELVWERADEFDLVVVTSPNRAHAPQALRAIEAGLPVVVDKPFAITAEQASGVVDAAAAAGVPLTVFQNRRWDGDFRTLRKLLDAGELGEVTRFESRFERWRPQLKGGWRESGSPEEAGGLLYDLGAHLIDQALTLFGPVVSVYAEVDRRRRGVAADDDTFVAVAHTNGVRSHLWVSAAASNLGPRMRVLGSRAAYVKYGMDVQEEALRSGGRPELVPDWGSEPAEAWGSLGTPGETRAVPTERGAYPDFYAAVAAALRAAPRERQARMPVDPRDSVEGLRVIAAARRSSREGCVVSP